jgi:hypothetical protein
VKLVKGESDSFIIIDEVLKEEKLTEDLRFPCPNSTM